MAERQDFEAIYGGYGLGISPSPEENERMLTVAVNSVLVAIQPK